jgi:hypothetical protein
LLLPPAAAPLFPLPRLAGPVLLLDVPLLDVPFASSPCSVSVESSSESFVRMSAAARTCPLFTASLLEPKPSLVGPQLPDCWSDAWL